MTALTARQEQVLGFIRKHLSRFGRPPTRDEICRHFGFKSPNAAECHLRALEAKGAIYIAAGKARGVEITRR